METTAVENIFMAADRRAVRKRPSRLEALPAEIKLLIIEQLLEIQSIINLALTGPAIYTFVAYIEHDIAAKVFVANIPRPFLPIAELILSFSNLPVDGNEYGENVAQALVSHNDKALNDKGHHWTLYKYLDIKDVQGAVQLHASLEQFASTLAQKALKKAPRKSNYSRLPISVSEFNRFLKALYILEAICKGFSRGFSSLRFHCMNGPESTYKKAWLAFWKQFAPWEMQHVRLVQKQVGVCMREALDHEVDKSNGAVDSLYFDPSRDDMAAFIISLGPGALWRLQRRAILLRKYIPFMKSDRRSLRVLAHDHRHDALWLNQDGSGRFSLDAHHIFEKYPEDDISAATVWYHTLLMPHVPDPGLFTGPYAIAMECDVCVEEWVPYMWDVERLNKAPRAPLPTMQQLEQAAFGHTVSQVGLLRNSAGRGLISECPGGCL
ncbi:hypothetical protein GGR57DRAFT_500943 [Xylariaceae sp. FL1272]|nr:hypothetical protein GGR57DRAFT_500943 [Xylariaceae sp. FL1272]